MKKLIRLKKLKYSTALMIDQRVSQGIRSKFFNHNALTTTIPAQLIKKFKLPIVPLSIERINNINFKIVIKKPIFFDNKEIIFKRYIFFKYFFCVCTEYTSFGLILCTEYTSWFSVLCTDYTSYFIVDRYMSGLSVCFFCSDQLHILKLSYSSYYRLIRDTS